MIPYSRQNINQNDINNVVRVLRSNWLTQGPSVELFEKAVSKRVGASKAVAVNSATSALHLACLALEIGPGDLVWTSANTFVASSNAALYCGAKIDFIDIDPLTYNISIKSLEKKLAHAKIKKKLPKLIIAVHYAGQPCDIIKIHKLSKLYGFKIIEDASHAIGATYKKIQVGSCKHSQITVFSFHPVKIITTGEGGMALTNDTALAERMYRLRTHGITKKKKTMKHRPSNEIWNYQQIELGFNYRMSDIQAGLGLSQLKRLDKFIARRRKIAKIYNKELKNLKIILPWQPPNTYSSYHLYPIRIQKKLSQKTQKQVYNYLRSKGIGVNLLYIPVHRQPYYESLGFKKGDFPEAEKFHEENLSLPIFFQITKAEINFVVKSLNRILNLK
jgi:UDP-4-amino-4,6-dideoxy-N-acetyl-beta-L-altrosamine transaminase